MELTNAQLFITNGENKMKQMMMKLDDYDVKLQTLEA